MKETTHKDNIGSTWHVWSFGLDEYLREARSLRVHPKNAEHHVTREFTGEREWDADFRGGTRDEALDLRTWPEGLAKLAEITLDDIDLPDVGTVKRTRCWGETGDEFSRDRFDAGHLDCWETRKRRRRRTGGQVVRITVELTANAKAKADTLVWTGLAAAKLADTLETAGHRVEIDITVTTRGANKSRTYDTVDVIRVKNASDPLSLDALVLTLAHPLFFRFCSFASTLRRPIKVSGGMGSAAATPDGLRGDIHLPKVFTKQDAERAVRDALTSATKGTVR